MPYAPGVQYNPMPLYYGLQSAGNSIEQGMRQRSQLEQQEADRQMRAKEMALNYGKFSEDQAKDYYIAQQRLDTEREMQGSRMADSAADRAMKARELDMREKPVDLTPEERATYDKAGYAPLRVSPRSFNAVPMKGAGAETPALGSDPTGTGGYYFNGKVLTQKRSDTQKPMDVGTASMLGGWKKQLEDVNTELADHQNQISQGDGRYGFLNAFSREERVKELMTKKAGLETQVSAVDRRGSRVEGGAAAPAAQGNQPSIAAGQSKPLDATTAKQFLIQANGDKAKAREMAKAAGYTF